MSVFVSITKGGLRVTKATQNARRNFSCFQFGAPFTGAFGTVFHHNPQEALDKLKSAMDIIKAGQPGLGNVYPQEKSGHGPKVPIFAASQLVGNFAPRELPAIGSSYDVFKVKAVMPDDEIKEISLSDYLGKKNVILLFYPLDFTFVCPSELLAFNSALDQFEARDTQVLGCSVDSEFTHKAWKLTPKSSGGLGGLGFPLLSDLDKNLARCYNVLDIEGKVALRGLFLINKEGKIVHSVVNDLPLGRSVDEALRMVDALSHFEQHGEVCPANWKKGKKAMAPTAQGVAEYLSTTNTGKN